MENKDHLLPESAEHLPLRTISPFSSPTFRQSLQLLSGSPVLHGESSGKDSLRNCRPRGRKNSLNDSSLPHQRRHSLDSQSQTRLQHPGQAISPPKSHSARSPSSSPVICDELSVGIVNQGVDSLNEQSSNDGSPGSLFLRYFVGKSQPPLQSHKKPSHSQRSLNGSESAKVFDSSSCEEIYVPLLSDEHNDGEYQVADDPHAMALPKGSSFTQSVFNTTNVIVGIGILSFPFAFRNAGWIGGSVMTLFIMSATCYSAQLLGRCLSLNYPKLQSFSDIGREAFGFKMEYFIGFIFFIELFLACAAYIILCGDNLEKLFPEYLTKREWMIFVTVIILPSTYLNDLAMLSYLSVFGIFASAFLLFAVVFTGFSTSTSPGSILHPAPSISFDLNCAPIALGLIMSGFAGHAVLPNIYHSMAKRKQYPSMINCAYSIAFFLYISMSIAGYSMFGGEALQEITLNLKPGVLSHAAVLMTIINPVTKFALTLNPIAINVESMVLLCRNDFRFECGTFNKILIRTAMTGLTLLTALYLPFFDRLMEFIGSFCSFTVSLIFPCICILKLCWRGLSWTERAVNIILASLGVCFAILGSYVAITGPLKF